MLEAVEIDKYGTVIEYKTLHAFQKPNRHIPPTNPDFDYNISPVIGTLFAATRSMQNIQIFFNYASLDICL